MYLGNLIRARAGSTLTVFTWCPTNNTFIYTTYSYVDYTVDVCNYYYFLHILLRKRKVIFVPIVAYSGLIIVNFLS